MSASCGWVVAFKLEQRVDNATRVQDALTKHGCTIRARLGLHETSKDYCANYGLIILQCCGTEDEINAMVADLNSVQGVCAKAMCMD